MLQACTAAAVAVIGGSVLESPEITVARTDGGWGLGDDSTANSGPTSSCLILGTRIRARSKKEIPGSVFFFNRTSVALVNPNFESDKPDQYSIGDQNKTQQQRTLSVERKQ